MRIVTLSLNESGKKGLEERISRTAEKGLFYCQLRRGVERRLALKIEALRERMDRLARSTGGRAIVTEKIDDLRSAFAELLDELSHQYLIGYSPTNSRHDGTLRHVKVEVDGKYQVRAREAYRAASPK